MRSINNIEKEIMNAEKLSKLAGIAAILSGLLFIIIQVIHPADQLASLTTTEWMIAHVLSFLFPIFGILGITGIYLKQVKQSGYLGLIGYLFLFCAFILMICFGFYEAFIAPVLATEATQYALNALSVLDGKAGPDYLGTVYQINGILYLLGSLLFGISLLKAKVFPIWAAWIILTGIITTLSAAAIPEMARPSAVIFGSGLACLGYVLTVGRYKH